mmetsp:Transcript_5013/g.14398  ORF Transcript_5013/g.14398 Transcript_5013/m.14398 type:complete len:340 (+) Transcript_5013:537-1556(+)
MNVVLNLGGHVEVYYMLYVSKVQPLRRHVSRHQHVLLSLLVKPYCLISLLLIFAAVNGHGLDTLQQKVFVDVVHVGLALAEDDYGRGRLLEALQEVDDFGLLLHVFHLLYYVQVGRPCPPYVYDHRLDESVLGEVLELPGEGRREQQRLALVGEVVHDLPHLLVESQVKHSVGLVEANVPTHVETDRPLLEEIPQTARRGDYAVHPVVPYRLELIPRALPPNDELRPERRVRPFARLGVEVACHSLAQALDLLEGLPYQLPRRSQYDPHRPLPPDEGHPHLLLQRRHDEGQVERHGLSAASEGDSNHIPPGERHGQPLHLNGSRAADVPLPQDLQYGGW